MTVVLPLLLCFVSLCVGGTSLFSFETGVDSWFGGTPSSYPSSSSQAGVYQNSNHATLGTYSLRVAFDHNSGKSQAVYLVENLNLDLSSYATFSFDLWKSGQPPTCTVAFSTGSGWEWHESVVKYISDGSNTVTVNLLSSDWKTGASGWSNSVPIANKNQVKRIAIVFQPTAEGFNEAFIDNVRVDYASSSTPAPTPRPTAIPTSNPTSIPTTKTTTKPTTKPTSAPTSSPAVGFVRTSGTHFVLNGCPFYFAGTNCYYLMYKSQFMVDDVLNSAVSMGLKVVRIWAMLDIGSYPDGSRRTIDGIKDSVYFQYWNTAANAPAYNDGASGLAHLDYVLASARAKGIRLVLTLVNNWSQYGGIDQYVAWYGQQYHDDFYSNAQIKQAYKNYAAHLINRVNTVNGIVYKNDPTIFAWELTNELRCKGSGTYGVSSSCSPSKLVSWVSEMSAYIKSVDPNHMVTVGDEGFFNQPGNSDWSYNGSEGGDYAGFLAVPTVDYGTFHVYSQDWGKDVSWTQTWITNHINAANSAGKPAVMEEFGWKWGGKSSYLQSFLNTAQSLNIAGTNYWMLAGQQDGGGLYPDYDSYTIYNDNSADANVIRTHASYQNSKNVC